MSPFAILSVSIGYAAESIFGFGGSSITYLIATQSIAPKEIIAVLPVFALTGSLMVLITDRTRANWKFILTVFGYALPGLVLGSLVIKQIPETLLSVGTLLLIILYSISLTAGKNPAVPAGWRKPLYILSGFIIGATSQGVVFILVLGSQLETRRSFRSSLALLWTLLALARVPMYLISGVLTRQAMVGSIVSLPFVALAIYIGFQIHKLIPDAHYKRYVGGVMAAAACYNLLRYIV